MLFSFKVESKATPQLETCRHLPKHLVIYWHSKELGAQEIYEKCCVHFGKQSVAYSTITDWLRKLNRNENILVRKTGSGRLSDPFIDTKIMKELNEPPFHTL